MEDVGGTPMTVTIRRPKGHDERQRENVASDEACPACPSATEARVNEVVAQPVGIRTDAFGFSNPRASEAADRVPIVLILYA